MLWTPGHPPLSLPAFEDGLTGRLARPEWQRRRRPVARLLESELAARGDALPGATPDELLPLLMAGQEPPAIALTWLLDRLGRDEQLAERFLAGGADADACTSARSRRCSSSGRPRSC
jgi:cytochrome P450 family 135